MHNVLISRRSGYHKKRMSEKAIFHEIIENGRLSADAGISGPSVCRRAPRRDLINSWEPEYGARLDTISVQLVFVVSQRFPQHWQVFSCHRLLLVLCL